MRVPVLQLPASPRVRLADAGREREEKSKRRSVAVPRTCMARWATPALTAGRHGVNNGWRAPRRMDRTLTLIDHARCSRLHRRGVALSAQTSSLPSGPRSRRGRSWRSDGITSTQWSYGVVTGSPSRQPIRVPACSGFPARCTGRRSGSPCSRPPRARSRAPRAALPAAGAAGRPAGPLPR